MIYFETVKNGNTEITYKIYYDISKPKCWVEGSEYKFNKQYLETVVKYTFRQGKNGH